MTEQETCASEIEYRLWKALGVLARAGETSDPHIKRESYIETLWRLRSIDTGCERRDTNE